MCDQVTTGSRETKMDMELGSSFASARTAKSRSAVESIGLLLTRYNAHDRLHVPWVSEEVWTTGE